MKKILLGLLGVMVGLGGWWLVTTNNGWYTEQLTGQILTPVLHDAEIYAALSDTNALSRSDRLKVQQLQHYALTARIDPLFALPGTNLDVYDRTIVVLEESLENTVALYTERESAVLREHLYPVTFLKQLSVLESKRRDLIDTVSVEKVERYHQLLRETIDVYILFVAGAKIALQEETASLENKQIAFYSGRSNISYLVSVYEDILQQANTQKQIAELRYRCFTGKKSVCVDLPNLELPELHEPFNLSAANPAVIPDTVTEQYDIVHSLRQTPYQGAFATTSLAVLSRSSCLARHTPAYYHLWWRDTANETRIFHPDVVNDLVFHNMTTGQESWQSYVDVFLEKGGGPYLFQVIATHYACPDLASDMRQLQTILLLETVPEIVYDGKDAELQLLVKAMNAIRSEMLSDAVASEFHAYQYLQKVRAVFAAYSPAQIAVALGRDTALELESVLVTAAVGSYRTAENIASVALNNDSSTKYGHNGVVVPLGHMLYAHAMPKMLWLVHNRSVVPLEPTFIETPATDLPSRVEQYHEVKEQYAPDVLVDILQNSIRVEAAIGRAAGLEYFLE